MSVHPLYPDSKLLLMLQDDDQSAFEMIYHRYYQPLYNTAYKLLKDAQHCAEIVHDVFLDVWERRSSLGIENLEAYLKKAVRFRVINYITRKKPPAFFELFDTIAGSSYNPQDALLEKDTLELIIQWVKTLPEKRRKIFVRHILDGMTTNEVADEMGISRKTVQNQSATSVQYLRSRLSPLLEVLLAILFASRFFIS